MNKISLELFPLKYFSIYRRENKISERMRMSDFLYTGFRNSRNFVLAYIFRESPPSFIREFEGDLVQNIIIGRNEKIYSLRINKSSWITFRDGTTNREGKGGNNRVSARSCENNEPGIPYS